MQRIGRGGRRSQSPLPCAFVHETGPFFGRSGKSLDAGTVPAGPQRWGSGAAGETRTVGLYSRPGGDAKSGSKWNPAIGGGGGTGMLACVHELLPHIARSRWTPVDRVVGCRAPLRS